MWLSSAGPYNGWRAGALADQHVERHVRLVARTALPVRVGDEAPSTSRWRKAATGVLVLRSSCPGALARHHNVASLQGSQ